MRKQIVLICLCYVLTVFTAVGCSSTSNQKNSSETELETFKNTSSTEDTTLTVNTTSVNTTSDEDETATYMDYLNGKSVVKISEKVVAESEERFYTNPLSGKYSFDELKKTISDNEITDLNAKYAFCDFGQDGTKELILRFEGIGPSDMNWTGIIHNNGDELILNYFYEDGYRSEASLYDSGYLLINGSNGAGSHGSTLTGFDKDGYGYDIFTTNEYYGYFVENMEYNLTQTPALDSDNHAIPYESELVVIELKTDNGVKFSVYGGWSEDEPIKYEEEDYINYLVSLGAELISVEEMEKLSSLTAYQSDEIIWTSFDLND